MKFSIANCENCRKSRTKCWFFCIHVSCLESLVFLWRRRIYGGSWTTSPIRMCPHRLSCRFAWQAWHFVTFQPFDNVSKMSKFEEVSYEMLVFLHSRVLARVAGFPVASPCLWGKLQNISFLKVSKQVVMLSCVAGVALRDIPTCLITCRKYQNWRKSRTKCSFFCTHVSRLVCLVFLWRRQVYGGTLHTPHFTLHTLHFPLHTPHSTLHTLLYTPHSTLYTLHSSLHTPHFTLLPFHSTLHTLHTTLHFPLQTPHSTLYAPHSTLYTPHFTLHTPHFTLLSPHFTLLTPHSTLYTLHSTLHLFTLHTLHSTLYTLHFTLYNLQTPRSSLHTLHSSLYTPHSTLCTLHSSPHTLDPTLHTPHSTLHTLHFTLHTPHSTLYTPHSTLYTLYTPHSTLYTPHSLLHTPHSTLYTFHSTLQTGNKGNMYKTVQLNYCRKVLCVTAYPCVLTSVPVTYV